MRTLAGYMIGILGGDQREKVMMEELLQLGATLKVLGDPGDPLSDQVIIVNNIDQVVVGVQALVAPMSGTDDQGGIKARFIQSPIILDEAFFQRLKPGSFVLIGMANQQVQSAAKRVGVNLQQIAMREDVGILNAIPTAEGVLQIAMEELPITIHGSKSLVIGLGKCGLTLAWRLRVLGSQTYGVTRSSEAVAKALDLGIQMLTYESLDDYLNQFDLVVNTVPAPIITRQKLEQMRSDVLIIDLASAPGGTDFDSAEELGVKALLSLGLPGKVAPRTAGKILGKVVPDMILQSVQ